MGLVLGGVGSKLELGVSVEVIVAKIGVDCF
jgi:hypothetical protein